jgi:predicted DNA-binding transcriptional regulator AlpA
MPTSEVQFEPVLVDRAGLRTLGIPFSNAHLLRLESEGRFPRRMSIGTRNTFWLLAEIRAFIADRASDQARAETMTANRAAAQPGLAARHVSRGASR